jgi:hypothetical protein
MAELVTFFTEADQNRHLVLKARGVFMVAEIAEPRRVESFAASAMRSKRFAMRSMSISSRRMEGYGSRRRS